jgi:hypothetical protein
MENQARLKWTLWVAVSKARRKPFKICFKYIMPGGIHRPAFVQINFSDLASRDAVVHDVK